MFGLFKKSHADADATLFKRALSPEVAVVVSASCCMPGTAAIDSQVEAVAKSALQRADLAWPVLTVTLTQAQASLARISGELTESQGALAREVSGLFMSTGLSAFPILIVDQCIVSYGGAPGEKLVSEALASKWQVKHEQTA